MQRILLSLVCILFLCGTATAEEFDLQDWIKRPGVRAVAVEFYATWCKPCMEAMPRWKALKDRFGKDGLRVIVVNTQEAAGKVSRLDWTPDAFISDPDGQIAAQFGVGDSLPSAFLWSWQGQLLVRQGHIDAVEGAVERVLHELPRVSLEPEKGVDPLLVEAVKGRLLDSGKVVVVASASDQARLNAERLNQTQNVMVDESKKCEIGKEIPPNALLRLAVLGSPPALTLTLIDIESGCQKSAFQTPMDAAVPDRQRASLDAVEGLLSKMRVPFERPRPSLPLAAVTPPAAGGPSMVRKALIGTAGIAAIASTTFALIKANQAATAGARWKSATDPDLWQQYKTETEDSADLATLGWIGAGVSSLGLVGLFIF